VPMPAGTADEAVADGRLTAVDTPISPNVKFKILSSRFEQTHGVCTVFTTLNPASRAATQADIDADGDKRIDENFWLTSLKKVKMLKEVKIESHGQKMVHGHKAYFVVAVITGTVEGVGDVTLKTQQMMEAIPGQFFLLGCAAHDADDGYPLDVADFETVLNSFAPLSDAPVAMLEGQGVSSLTMYSQPRFGGVSRVVTQDAPDLAAFGWRGPTASMSVAGGGAWEVCDGANFAGTCQTVSGTNAAHGGAQPVLEWIAAQGHALGVGPAASTLAEPHDGCAPLVPQLVHQCFVHLHHACGLW